MFIDGEEVEKRTELLMQLLRTELIIPRRELQLARYLAVVHPLDRQVT